jgi:hypothetical protein
MNKSNPRMIANDRTRKTITRLSIINRYHDVNNYVPTTSQNPFLEEEMDYFQQTADNKLASTQHSYRLIATLAYSEQVALESWVGLLRGETQSGNLIRTVR